MSLNSSTVTAWQQALDSQYNNLRKDVIQHAWDYATSGGSSSAYTLTLDAQYTAYTAGDVIQFKANHTNTGASTINVNSLGAKSIKHNVSETLIEWSIINGEIITLRYDGTNFLMVKQWRPEQPIVSATWSTSWSPTTAILLTKGGFVTALWVGYKSTQTTGTIGTLKIEKSLDGSTGWSDVSVVNATGYFQFATDDAPIIMSISALIPPNYYYRCSMSNVDTVVSIESQYQAFV